MTASTCVNRITSDTPRARFTPEEVVKLTMDFCCRNYIECLFLSSGIIQDSDYIMGQMVSFAKTLRERKQFNGYLKTRRHHAIRGEDLPRIGIVYKKARPFSTTADQHAAPLTLDSTALASKLRPKQQQLSLFD